MESHAASGPALLDERGGTSSRERMDFFGGVPLGTANCVSERLSVTW